MLNYLKFKNPKHDEIYSQRGVLYKKCSTIEELFLEYTSFEPHCFLHASSLSKTISKYNLNGVNAISIGIDFLKELILIKNNDITIDSFDIDDEAVIDANNLAEKYKISNSLKYFKENVLFKGFQIKDKYELCILSQMDYILTDEEIHQIVKLLKSANIKYILVITPSIFSFNLKPLKNLPYKMIDYVFIFLLSIKKKFTIKDESYITFRRRESYFLNLFKKEYACLSKYDYSYPSGREYTFLLKSR